MTKDNSSSSAPARSDGATRQAGNESELTLVYRVQDADGRGPFKPGLSHRWVDDSDKPHLPSWMEEFGHDLIKRRGIPGECYGTAVRKLSDLNRWFTPTEQRKLADLGYQVVAVLPDRILAESKNQLVFARNTPLRRRATIIPWSALRSGADETQV